MKVASMVIVIFVLTLVIRLWVVDSMEEEGLEAPMTQLDVGRVIKSNMLLPRHTLRCYTCSGFGHKAQKCKSQRSQPRRSTSYTSARRFEDHKTNSYSQGHSQAWRNEFDQRSVGSSNSLVRCWTCNNVGHIAAYCRTMRCYSCNGLGHKAQDCWSTQKQHVRSFLYGSSRKASTDEGSNAQSMDAKKLVWMRKTKQLQIGEVDQTKEDGCHMASQV